MRGNPYSFKVMYTPFSERDYSDLELKLEIIPDNDITVLLSSLLLSFDLKC